MVCAICQSNRIQYRFAKQSKDGYNYKLYNCLDCHTLQVNPIPDQDVLDRYYTNEYFTRRSGRGYENYYSEAIREELFRVWNLNLRDLQVLEGLRSLAVQDSGVKRKSLDIGCAAGYFVDYCRSSGLSAEGIEISEEPVRYAREILGLDVHREDFLEWDTQYKNRYDFVSLWASIEHMREPIRVLKKIHGHLTDDGVVVLSTCRYGILARIRGLQWRFLNVPEHLFYWTFGGFLKMMDDLGYECLGYVSYGSGMTARKSAGAFFRFAKMALDRIVKLTNQGDMMAFAFRKKQSLVSPGSNHR